MLKIDNNRNNRILFKNDTKQKSVIFVHFTNPLDAVSRMPFPRITGLHIFYHHSLFERFIIVKQPLSDCTS